jgi:hypothetical protein
MILHSILILKRGLPSNETMVLLVSTSGRILQLRHHPSVVGRSSHFGFSTAPASCTCASCTLALPFYPVAGSPHSVTILYNGYTHEHVVRVGDVACCYGVVLTLGIARSHGIRRSRIAAMCATDSNSRKQILGYWTLAGACSTFYVAMT